MTSLIQINHWQKVVSFLQVFFPRVFITQSGTIIVQMKYGNGKVTT